MPPGTNFIGRLDAYLVSPVVLLTTWKWICTLKIPLKSTTISWIVTELLQITWLEDTIGSKNVVGGWVAVGEGVNVLVGVAVREGVGVGVVVGVGVKVFVGVSVGEEVDVGVSVGVEVEEGVEVNVVVGM